MLHRPWFLRRPWFRLDLYAALESFRTLFRRDRTSEEETKKLQCKLDVLPMDWRNPPSESITNTLLPLAATAAGAAAALYFASALSASETQVVSPLTSLDHEPEGATGSAGGGAGYDLSGVGVTSLDLPSHFEGSQGTHASPREGENAEPGTAVAASTGSLASKEGEAPGSGGGGVNSDVHNTSSLLDPGSPHGDHNALPSLLVGGSGSTSTGNPASSSAAASATPSTSGSTGNTSALTGGSNSTGAGSSISAGSSGSSGDPNTAPTTNPDTLPSSGLNLGTPGGNTNSSVATGFTSAPLRFVTNEGQWGGGVDFAADVGGTRISVNSQSASIAVPLATAGPPESTIAASPTDATPQQYSTIQMLWNGVNPDAQPTGEDRLSSVSNFLVGNDPSAWKTNVAEYGGVRYANAWNGIDLVYHQADTSALEYDLVVKPGASPSTASFSVQGATAALTDGKLVLTTPSGAQVVQDAPVLYQLGTDGTRQTVAGQFQIRADGSVGYTVGQYDPTRDLVIDPVVNNYCELPGTYDDRAYGIATDSDGNAYLTGSTSSSNFTTTTGAFDTSFDGGDAFVTKLDSVGNVVWSTYLGGSGGDHAGGIAIGPDGGVFVTGATGSSDFPTTGGAYQTTGSATVTTIPDAFLAKLSDDGTSLDYATYLGGTGNEEGKGVAVDQSTGEAVIVGYSAGYPSGTDFPTVNAYQTARGGYEDAFVARFTDDGSGLVFSTLLGGSGFNAVVSDEASDVAIDSDGNAFVVGYTYESNFPTVNGYDTSLGGSADAFLSEFDPTGTLVASTYYGGSGGELPHGVAVDGDGSVYVTGQTNSSDLPLVNPAIPTFVWTPGFLAKFSSLSAAPAYATYTPGQDGGGVAVDSSNRAYVVGNNYGSLWAARYEADGSTTDWSASWAYPFGALTDWLGAAVDPDGNLWAGGAVGNNPYNAIAVKIGPLAAPIITSVADDTGSSASDGVTYDSSQTITGTAYPSGTVTIYRRGPADAAPVAIGTTYASMYGGGWSYTDWSFPPDGVYTYYAQVTASGETSPLTAPITVTLDTTAPTISLSVATQTYDVTPDILVTASDLVGFPSPVTVTLDVDLNNNGNFTDAGESGYATAVLTNGMATFDGYTALTPGNTYRFRARITDLAGNEGTSSSTTTDILTSPSNWPGTDVTPTDNSPYGKNVLAVDGMLAAGNVTTSQALDLDVSAKACDCQDPYLIYNSQEAAPAPVVKATLLSNNALALPSHVYGTLTWDGVAGSTIDYDLSGLSVGGEWLFGAAPTSSLATGRHTYTLSLFVDYDGTTNDHLVTITGATFLANRSASPYGAGWSFSNTDTLVPIASDGTNPAGLLRLYGKGGWGFFTDAGGGTYTSPAGDGGTLVSSGGGWVYTSSGGRVLTFNSSGQMTTWAHPAAGETLTYTYDASGGVATMAGPDGGVATFSYSSGLLATIQAPGDRTVTVAYSGSDIAQVVNPDSSTHDFTYTGDLLITDSGLGGNISYAYDSFGLVDGYSLGGDAIIVSGQSAGLGDAVTVGPSHSLPVLYIDPLGAATNSFYNSRGQVLQRQSPVGAVEQYERDSNGFVTKYTDPLSRTTTFTVDAAGNVLGQTKPDSSSASWVYGGANNSLTKYTDPSGGVWTYTNDGYGNLLTVTDPLDHTTTLTYNSGLLATVTDPLGNVATVLYDAERRPIGGLRGGAVTGTTGYDAEGNPNLFTDPLGNVTTTTFDKAGHVRTVTDALGDVTSYAYDSKGRLLSMTDPLGNVTSYAYDSAGRQVAEIDAYGTGLERRTTSVYDDASQLIATIDPLGNRTTSVYDKAGHVIATVDPLGHRTTQMYNLAGQVTDVVDPLGRVTHTHYDSQGRVDAVTDPLGNTTTTVYDTNSNVIATVDPLGHRTTSVYDAANRLIASVDALGDRTSYGYDNADRLVTMTDPLGNVTTTQYDPRGNVAFTEDALGHRVTFAYDAADNLVSITDPLNHTTTSVYDPLNRSIATIDALGNRTTAVFDAAGNRTASVDALGNRTTSVYDALNRPVETVDALNHRWTAVYDAADRVVGMVDPLGHRTTSVYDAASQPIATIDALGNRTTNTFDVVGNLVATTNPLNQTTSFAYDALGRQALVTDALNHTWTTTFDAAGRLVGSTDPNGHTVSSVYDDADRLIASADPLGDSTSYGYDAASNLVTMTDPLGNVTTRVYDALNRQIATIDALGNRTTAVYDAAGNRTVAIDALGNRTTSAYDAANRPITTTDALGNVWTTTYDAAANVVSATDPLNHTNTSVYDALNRVVVGIDALGNRTTSTFDAAGNLVTITDALNHTTSYGYDARNLSVTTTDALGNVWTTHYDAAGRQDSVTDPLNRTTTFTFDAAGRSTGQTDAGGNSWITVYDDAGNRITSVDPLGNSTITTYDEADRPVSVTDALGNVGTAVYDAASNRIATIDPLNHTTTAVFDALNRQIATVDALGNRTTAVFDAAGNQTVSIDALGHRTTATFDALNRVSTVTDALGGVQTTTYDAAGNVRTMVDELGRTTTSAYDAADRQVTVTDALGDVWTSSYDAVGNLVGRTDPLNHTTTSVYDAANQMIASVDALGHRTTSVFDAAGQRTVSIDALGFRTTSTFDARGLLQTVTDPLNHTRVFGYDSAGNPVTQTDPRGNTTTTSYDADNRPVEVTDALGNTWTSVYDAASNVIASIDPLNNTTTAVYDDLNRQIASVSPLGNCTTSTFDAVGNLLTTTNGAGEVTSYGYDALNRQITTTDPLGFVTTSVYDAVGNRTGLIDASGNHTTWVLDALNRVTTETNPLNASSTMAYDAAGRETGETDRLGRRRDFTYDDVGRMLTEKWYAVGGGFTQTQTWSYDAVGQMLTAQDPDGRYTFTYDGAGNVATVAEPFGLSLTFGYDAANNRTSVLDSQNGVTSVVFDPLNRQTSEQVAGSGVSEMRFDSAYNERGETCSLTRYSDVAGSTVVGTTAYQYDADGHETNLEQTSGAGTVLANYTYTYDAADRVTSKVENGTTTSFNYDLASQLTEDGASTFGYDATGNRTNSGYVTDPGNRIQTDGVWTYTFDAEGNLTKKCQGASSDTWVYTYDNRNQMLTAVESATDGGAAIQRVTYVYDALGNRIERDAWDGSTATVERYGLDGWDTAKPSPIGNENFDTWADLDGGNVLTTRRVTGDEANEQIARQTASGGVDWYLTDNQGSVQQVIDNSGSVTATSTFDAYGNLMPGGNLSDRFGFQGMEFDATTGDYFDRARVYDPGIGKFTSEDLKFPESGNNAFVYAGNGPTNATDPSGMWVKIRNNEAEKQAWLALGKRAGVKLGFTYESDDLLRLDVSGVPITPGPHGHDGHDAIVAELRKLGINGVRDKDIRAVMIAMYNGDLGRNNLIIDLTQGSPPSIRDTANVTEQWVYEADQQWQGNQERIQRLQLNQALVRSFGSLEPSGMKPLTPEDELSRQMLSDPITDAVHDFVKTPAGQFLAGVAAGVILTPINILELTQLPFRIVDFIGDPHNSETARALRQSLRSEDPAEWGLALGGSIGGGAAGCATGSAFRWFSGNLIRSGRTPVAPAAGKGLSGRTGLSYDNKHLQKHLPDTPEAAKLIKKEGAAHVFTDEATLRRVEAEILARGESTGAVRGAERYGLRFDEPIGYRIDAAGNKIPLHYGELKLDPATGKYHVIPRTGPSK